jgi:tetratricopeptide (TPR) repeat protein
LGGAILLAAAAIGFGYRGAHQPARAVTAPVRRSVAVLDFRNLTARAESEWLATAIPEILRAHLAAGQIIRTIPGENISRMESELSLRSISSPSADTLKAIRRNLGADWIISGSYADLGPGVGDRVQVDIWAQDAGTGEVVASVSESGDESGVIDVIARAGAALREGLHLPRAANGERAARAASPQTPAAARVYAEGLAHLRRDDFLQARDLLLDCVRREPRFAPAHASLAWVYGKLGYDAFAREEARQAHELSGSQDDPELAIALEARYREANQQWDRAIDGYRRLVAGHPDDIEYGLLLAEAEIDASRPADALRTLDTLRALPPPESGDPRIDYDAALAAANLSDYRRAAGLAAEGARKAKGLNAQLLYARTISLESGILSMAGDARWEPLSQEARAICAQFGDQACIAAILRRVGNSRLVMRDLDGAERNYGEALKIARGIGSVEEESKILSGQAALQSFKGDLAENVRIEERLLALSRTSQSRHAEQASLDLLAQALLEQGKIEEARKAEQTALNIAREIGAQNGVAGELLTLSDIAEREGNLAAARHSCDEAQPLAARLPPEYRVAALEQKARLSLLDDDLAGARSALDEAAQVRKSWPDGSGADHQLAARFALAAGKLPDAESLAREAIKIAADHRLLHEQARAEALLALALLAQGKSDAARATMQQATARIEHSQFRLIRLEVAIANARVTGAADQLPPLIGEARMLNDYELEIEGRVVSAQLSHDSVQLAALQKEALSRGFRNVAREAATKAERQVR